jgi:hypothetical protein
MANGYTEVLSAQVIYNFFIYIHITLDAEEVKMGVPTFLLP